MLQADPPPKAVKVTVSKRVPLTGDELIAYEEEQNRKKEEALKASLLKEEQSKASHGIDNDTGDPMIIDAGTGSNVAPEGMMIDNCSFYYHVQFFFIKEITSIKTIYLNWQKYLNGNGIWLYKYLVKFSPKLYHGNIEHHVNALLQGSFDVSGFCFN